MAHVLLWPFFDEIQSHEPYVLCTVADCLKAMRIGDAVGRGNQPEGESERKKERKKEIRPRAWIKEDATA